MPVEGILVVIPCLNEANYIANVIGNVLRDRAAGRTLIVVADGGSTDGSAEIVSRIAARHPNVRLMPNPKRIQGAGVNLAARRFGSRKRWLIRMDAHAEYPAAFVSQLVAEAERTRAASVVVAMRSLGRRWFQRAIASAQNSALGSGGAAHRSDGTEGYVDHGHHALMDMSSFFAVRGYDENQSHNEDAELDCRLTRAGGRIWLTRSASIEYYPRESPGDLYRQYWSYGCGRAATLLRHRNGMKLRQLLPAGVLPSVILALASPWIAAAALPSSLWVVTCLVFGTYLAGRDRSFCALASGPAAMVMHMGWSIGFWAGIVSAATRYKPRLRLSPETVR
jgi:succinoglycan biosynthesis protein ExoA